MSPSQEIIKRLMVHQQFFVRWEGLGQWTTTTSLIWQYRTNFLKLGWDGFRLIPIQPEKYEAAAVTKIFRCDSWHWSIKALDCLNTVLGRMSTVGQVKTTIPFLKAMSADGNCDREKAKLRLGGWTARSWARPCGATVEGSAKLNSTNCHSL